MPEAADGHQVLRPGDKRANEVDDAADVVVVDVAADDERQRQRSVGDLTTGRAFRISRDFVGSFDFGYFEPAPPSITVGFAAAASKGSRTLRSPRACS